MSGFFEDINRLLDRFLTPAVKTILLINVGVTLATLILGVLFPSTTEIVLAYLMLWPLGALQHLMVWQFLTYMFIHLQVMHLLFNMLALWFFAPELENRWGTRFFWMFYLGAGIGAGLFHALIAQLTGHHLNPLIGASGAIYGVLLAFACYWPERPIYVWGIVPMKSKHFVLIFGFLEFLFTAAGREDNISHLTHLMGLVTAYLILAVYHRTYDLRRWRWMR